jgi:alpha-galactosidase
VYQAALLDPNTAATLSIDEIVQVCDELIDAHGQLIPEGIRAS